jgi:hypothetical protein
VLVPPYHPPWGETLGVSETAHPPQGNLKTPDEQNSEHRVLEGWLGRVTRQLYFPDTAMLITRFMTPDG